MIWHSFVPSVVSLPDQDAGRAIDSSEGLGFQRGPILDLGQDLQSIPHEQNRILNPGSLDRWVPGKRLVFVDAISGPGPCQPVTLLVADRAPLRMHLPLL